MEGQIKTPQVLFQLLSSLTQRPPTRELTQESAAEATMGKGHGGKTSMDKIRSNSQAPARIGCKQQREL